jgi:hypothetical protein
VKYELWFYNPEEDTLHSHSRENQKSYVLKGKFALEMQIHLAYWVNIKIKAIFVTNRGGL